MSSDPHHLAERSEIETYIRNRLLEECQRYGTRSRVARMIGFNPSHITNVLQGHRGAGEIMARRLAAYWGISYAELEQLARGLPPDPQQDRLPNLRLTIEWCREGYPADFLRTYERLAREAKAADRPRRDWLDDIDRELRNWARGGGVRPPGVEPTKAVSAPEEIRSLPKPALPEPSPDDGERSRVRKKLRQSLKRTG